ncbi:hypothetical protein VTL71DRAFT_7188 [Oculimacula yallundae]|uniref:Zn 2cys6 transcription factor protein n=1 Tax=Oculimacula yallundae TaxID=86028 RepID=A0ABR4BVZ8_9HELO
MGRKPNALILQHFERGAKLNDSSNRYEHTCKACGEKFPKGRIDSLSNHLTKKCPALSMQDRQKAALELHNLPHLPENARGEVLMNGQTMELPIGHQSQDNWSALSVLAEVSRQIDSKEKHDDRSVHNQSAAGGRMSEPPRGIRLEIQEHYTPENPPVSYEQRVQRDKKSFNQKYHQNIESSANQANANFNSQMTDSRSSSPNLAMATTATNMAAAAAAARFVPSMVDPQLLADDASAQASIPARTMEQALNEASASFAENMFNGAQDQPLQWPMLDGSGINHFQEGTQLDQAMEQPEPQRAIIFTPISASVAMHPSSQPPMTTQFSAEFGNGQKTPKQKGRVKFSGTRRKEVSKVRSIGACLRCRMLKKPCSDGTPCTTCKSVESARLWKQPCVRTRLADELEMYSAGLHVVLAHQQITSAKTHITFQPSPNQIEASHYPETPVFATFNALEGQPTPIQGNIDPILNGEFGINTLHVLDHENDDLPLKLEAYMKRIANVFIEREASHFMNVTLNTAQRLAIEDTLLGQALELWSVVQMLVDHNPRWSISERVNNDAQPGQGPPVSIPTYDLLVSQLNAAAEKKAATLCKEVLSVLERRLLARSASTKFDTFLVALIVLNCVEKSTWLFKSWEQDHFKARWPLDKIPSFYATQGERLTNLLQMLLHMRQIIPKTYINPEGIIATDIDAVTKEYFQELQLNYDDVLNKQANHTFHTSNTHCYELRFCSHLLLPPK